MQVHVVLSLVPLEDVLTSYLSKTAKVRLLNIQPTWTHSNIPFSVGRPYR